MNMTKRKRMSERHKLELELGAGLATQTPKNVAQGRERPPFALGSLADEIRLDGLTATSTSLNVRLIALTEHNRELAEEVNQLRAEVCRLRSRAGLVSHPEPMRVSRVALGAALSAVDERRRLERDLHDGVQGELVSLLLRLRLVEEDPDLPPPLARKLALLADHAIAALHSVRELAHGLYPLVLVRFGLLEALRSMAARASLNARVEGTVPRGSEDNEAAVYFAASEALQNIAKHAGGGAQVALRLHHQSRTLHLRIEDDGPGFDPAQATEGSGLRNIRDRIETLGGRIRLDSNPGRGTVLSVSVPWPARADGGQSRDTVADPTSSRSEDLQRSAHYSSSKASSDW